MSHRLLSTAAAAVLLATVGLGASSASAQPFGPGPYGWHHHWRGGPGPWGWHHPGPWGWHHRWGWHRHWGWHHRGW